MKPNQKVALIILDGWGYGKGDHTDAIFEARTPVFDGLLKKYPNARLKTDGEAVGLPEGQMGNSEVGHLNIGAGRVVYQDLVKINRAITQEELGKNEILLQTFDYVKKQQKKLHFIGLVSDGGIHSHLKHLEALVHLANQNQVKHSFIHAFTDGRDTDPKSGLRYLNHLTKNIAKTPTKVASIIGRYYAMDRDLRWERVAKAYHLLVNGSGKKTKDWSQTISESYDNGITDEFIEPIVITQQNDQPLATIDEGDAVICFNFRTDRCREITRALTQEAIVSENLKPIPLHYVTMTNYDETFKNVQVLFHKDHLQNTLGEVVSKHGKTQIRIAETEKYPHVAFFFSGGRENEFEGEKRIMVNSPKVATYDLQPEMSAPEVSSAIINEIERQSADFICLNFANPDMVGHTGVKTAIIKAVETVDQELGKIIEVGLANQYAFLIIADHGNADYILNADGSPNTAHSKNLVPIILLEQGDYKIADGKLADVAPTILKLMGLPQPNEMNGNLLIH